MAGFRLLIVITALGMVTTAVPGHAGSRIFKCEIAHAQTLLGDGSMGPDNMTKLFAQRRSPVRFDEASGLLRFDTAEPDSFQLIQEGTSESDLVAIRQFRGPAAVVIQVFRIRTWEPAVPFSLIFSEDVYSGTCHVE
jgi:hypothetical protein